MPNRKMNLGDVKVGTCYVSNLRGEVVSIIAVAHTESEKRAVLGNKFKRTQHADVPVWTAIGPVDGARPGMRIAGDGSDLAALEFVPRTDARWFDPNAPTDKTTLKAGIKPIDAAVRTLKAEIAKLKKAGVWGASTLEGDITQFSANLDAICIKLDV